MNDINEDQRQQEPPKADGWYWIQLIIFVWLFVVVIRALDQLGFV